MRQVLLFNDRNEKSKSFTNKQPEHLDKQRCLIIRSFAFALFDLVSLLFVNCSRSEGHNSVLEYFYTLGGHFIRIFPNIRILAYFLSLGRFSGDGFELKSQ